MTLGTFESAKIHRGKFSRGKFHLTVIRREGNSSHERIHKDFWFFSPGNICSKFELLFGFGFFPRDIMSKVLSRVRITFRSRSFWPSVRDSSSTWILLEFFSPECGVQVYSLYLGFSELIAKISNQVWETINFPPVNFPDPVVLVYVRDCSYVGNYCDPYWDNPICWPPTPANTTVTLQCPALTGYDTSSTKILCTTYLCFARLVHFK